MKQKFHHFVDQFQQSVYSLACYMLGNGSDAEDATQDVYVRLWRNINKVDERHAKAWLLAVTRNVCIDRLRARRPLDNIDDIEVECSESRYQPAKALASSRLSDWLKRAIASLSEPYQSLVVMSELQQKSHREIATELALNTNQVKVYLHRARRQLRENRVLREFAADQNLLPREEGSESKEERKLNKIQSVKGTLPNNEGLSHVD